MFCALLVASCGGAFSGTEAAGGASHQGGGGAGDSSQAGARAGGAEDTGGTSNGGTSASSDGGDGALGSGDAGTSASGGEAGAATGPCGLFHDGLEFDGHCYVDVTVNSASQATAVAACERMAPGGKIASHLLVLDSSEEQNFVLRSFMVPFTDMSDAWIGLTCSELSQPDINACYCAGCTKAMLAEKQQAWASLTGASSTFGWVNGNPNEPYRCAALAYNPDTTIWGWVDRPCDKSSFQPSSGHQHWYRTLCEFEP
ncbi:MAG TPA: hypothetical protein VER96_39685 [Polyangiaceae bacterium]|nr:hypothetical protein [Polyangiaceae bacterium]